MGPRTLFCVAREQQMEAMMGMAVYHQMASPKPARGPNRPVFRLWIISRFWPASSMETIRPCRIAAMCGSVLMKSRLFAIAAAISSLLSP